MNLVYLAYLLLTCILAMDLCGMLMSVHCLRREKESEHILLILYHATSIIFSGLQIIFFQRFLSIEIKEEHRERMKYIVSTLIGINICIWLHTFLQLGILDNKEQQNCFEYRYMKCLAYAYKNDTTIHTNNSNNYHPNRCYL